MSGIQLAAIMPTYNQDKWIEAALASVQPQVGALIIVDDGSRDKTTHIARAWTIEHENVYLVTHENNRGTASAINSGQEALPKFGLTPEWLTWVSSDNVHAPNWKAQLMAAGEPNVGVVYSAFLYVRGRRETFMFRRYDPGILIANENCFFGPSFAIRYDVWLETGQHQGKISHDYDHWLRVEETCWKKGLEIVGVPNALCRYNAHNERVTVTRRHEYDATCWRLKARERRGLGA